MNTQITLLASVARAADSNSADIDNTEDYQSAIIVIDVTLDPGSASVVFTVQGKDLLSGEYYTILASAAITAVGTTVLHIGDGTVAEDNISVGTRLPRVWRINVNHAVTQSMTYSVGADLSSGPVRA